MDTKIKVKGIVYKITNKVNGKIYIGKTKTHYGNNIKPYGIRGRLQSHISAALCKYVHKCPALSNAIVKYGKENFAINEILRCNLARVNDFEIALIEIFDSTNKKIVYNIALGGGGLSVVTVSEETRKKMSKKGKYMNMSKIFRNGILVGYSVERKEKGKKYAKWFSSTKNTLEQNKKLAEEWLKKFREGGIIGEANYNKESKLPKYIYKKKDTGKHVGYSVHITRNGKNNHKMFL